MNSGFKWFICIALILIICGCKKANYIDLIKAVETNDLPEVRRLLDEGISANVRDKRGYPVLYFASYRGYQDIVKLLIEKGADVNAKGDTGYTPLHGAAQGGRLEVAEILIEKGAEVNAVSVHGITPLREARNNDVAELLRQHSGN